MTFAQISKAIIDANDQRKAQSQATQNSDKPIGMLGTLQVGGPTDNTVLSGSNGKVSNNLANAVSATPKSNNPQTYNPASTIKATTFAAPTNVKASLISPIATVQGPQQASQVSAQDALIAQLQGQAAGTSGPSAAQLLLNQQTGQNLNNQLALAASLPGNQISSANRQIMQNQAVAQQQAIQQAAILRAQEQQQAQSLLGTTVNQAIGNQYTLTGQQLQAGLANQQTAYNTAAQNAQLAQQANLANQNVAYNTALQNALLNQQGNIFNAQQTQGQNQFVAGQNLAYDQAALNAAMQQYVSNNQLAGTQYAADKNASAQNKAASNQLIGSLLGGAGALGAAYIGSGALSSGGGSGSGGAGGVAGGSTGVFDQTGSSGGLFA